MGREAKAKADAQQQRADLHNDRLMGPVLRHGVYARTGCPKCPVPPEGLKWTWHVGYNDVNDAGVCRVVGEHLHGECRGCGFMWREQPKDVETEAGNPQASPIGARMERGKSVALTLAGPSAVGEATEA